MKHFNQFNGMDFEKAGFMYGLSGEAYHVVENYFKSIDFNLIQTEFTSLMIIPCVRRTLGLILAPSADGRMSNKQFRCFEKDNELLKNVMGLYSTKEIITLLDNFAKSKAFEILKEHFKYCVLKLK